MKLFCFAGKSGSQIILSFATVLLMAAIGFMQSSQEHGARAGRSAAQSTKSKRLPAAQSPGLAPASDDGFGVGADESPPKVRASKRATVSGTAIRQSGSEVGDPCVACNASQGKGMIEKVAPILDIVNQAQTTRASLSAGWGAQKAMKVIHKNCSANQHIIPFYNDGNTMSGWYRTGVHNECPEGIDLCNLKNHSPEVFYNPDELVQPDGDPYFVRNQSSPACRQTADLPVVFNTQSNDKPLVSMKEGRLHLNMFNEKFNNTPNKPMRSLDCSAVASIGFAAAGLKLRSTDSKPADVLCSTGCFGKIASLADSCLQPVQFSKQIGSLQSGDLFILNRKGDFGHSLIIDYAGDDPFGVKGLKYEKCTLESMDPKQFNFTVIMADGGKMTRSGMARFDAVDLVGGSYERDGSLRLGDPNHEEVATQLLAMAVEACKASNCPKGQVNCQAIPAGAEYQAESEDGIHQAKSFLLRHVGAAKPGCFYDKLPVLDHEDCVADEVCEALEKKNPSDNSAVDSDE
jgi:hypothetical protein